MLAIQQQLLSALEQGNTALDSLSDRTSESYVIPKVKELYRRYVPSLDQVKSYFAKRLEDPFSTETLLYYGKRIEDLSLRLAQQIPTQEPFFHFPVQYIHQSFISIGQHLYAYVKEVNRILQVPVSLKVFVKKISIDNYLHQSAQAKGRFFVFLNSVRLQVKRALLFVVDYIIRIADLFFQMIFANSQLQIFTYLREVLHHARDKIHDRFTDLAVQVIEKRETVIRKTLVKNIREHCLDFTSDWLKSWVNEDLVRSVDRVALKAGLGWLACCGVKSMLDGHTFALWGFDKFVGGATLYCLGKYLVPYVWKTIVRPHLDEYHQAYDAKFDPKKKTDTYGFLSRYLPYHSAWLLFWPIEKATRFLRGVE